MTLRLSFLILFTSLFFFCSKDLVAPEFKGLAIRKINLNQQGKIEINLTLQIFNSNDEDIELTFKKMNILKEGEVIGSLKEEKRFNLKKNYTNQIDFSIVLEDRNFLKSIYTFLIKKEITLEFKGDLIYHRQLVNFKFDFNEKKNISLTNIF